MNVKFDFFNRRRISSLLLCNPNGEELYSMPMAKDRTLSIGFNELSELTFEIPKYINNEEVTPYYEAIKTKRIVSLEDVGRFIITNIAITTDGVIETKKVTCKGLEFELSNKNLDILEGTYALYNPSNQDKSLLHIVLKYISNWSISEVDSELWDIWRTFDIKDNNIYNFLMGEVQEAFDCVFIFDTFKRTIKVVKTSNLPKKTDIFLSNRNLMKELNIEENADNIITALNVYGDGELSIHTVNPLGTATIYDFSYYTTLEWMSQGLINAVKAWQSKVDSSKTTYANLLLQSKSLDKELLVLKQELVDLEIGKKEIEQKLSLAVVANDNTNCALYKKQLEAKETQITNKNNQIKTKEKQIETNTTALSNISKSLSFENNFTKEQWLELDNFIIQASIQNTNYSTTDLTTVEEKQEIMTNLYNWAQEQLKKQSQPIWEFSIDSINFLNLIEYKDTSNQLELGCEVTIEVDKEKELYATAMLLGYSLNLDDFSDLELKFANVLRFNGSSYTFEELFNSTASISKNFDFESYTWDLGKEAHSKIDDYINSALDLTTQEIKASDNQEFTISNVGIRGMEYYPETNTYSKEQIWINKNVIAFSDDAFNSTKTALGKVTMPDGSKAYGLIGEVIVGKMLCGKTLVLENENSSFRVDGQGVTIKNGNIIMTDDDGTDKTLEETIQETQDEISKELGNSISQVYEDMKDMEESILDGQIVIFYQETKPSIPPAKFGDMWYDTSITNGIKKNEAWLVVRSATNNLIWEKIKDAEIIKALADAQNAQTTADGKITTYYSAEPPKGLGQKDYGDLWFDTDDNNKMYRWDGSKWVDVHDKYIDEVTNKLNAVIDPTTGDIRTDKLIGSIEAGKNNIDIINNATVKALKLNEVGLLIANSKTGSNWNWRTAISADGIVADAIKSEGTLSGVNILGGSLNIGTGAFTVDKVGNVAITKGTINMGSGAFKVDALGNVTVTKGSINMGSGAFTLSSAGDIKITKGSINMGSGAFTVDSNGNIKVTKGSIDIGSGAFTVDTLGNVVAKSLTLTTNTKGEIDANNLKINNLVVGGNVTMGANATISWEKVTGKDGVANKTDLTWSSISGKPTDLAYTGDLTWNNIKNRPTIPVLPNYIESTKISQASIESPSITGGTITGAVVQSYSVYGSGVMLDDDSVTWFDRSKKQCGIIRFDNTGAGTASEATNRLLIHSSGGYAMKIKSDGNMSIEASGSGRVYINNPVFTGTVTGATATFG